MIYVSIIFGNCDGLSVVNIVGEDMWLCMLQIFSSLRFMYRIFYILLLNASSF